MSELLNNPLWGRRFYDEEQQTYYVVLFGDLPQHIKNNPLAIAAAENMSTKKRKSKCNPGEVTIEWRIKSEKDAKERSYCETGFIFVLLGKTSLTLGCISYRANFYLFVIDFFNYKLDLQL